MKIHQISPSVKTKSKTKLKQATNLPAKVFFVGKLKQLIKDTFKINSKEEEKLVSRKCPNWCEPEDSTYVNKTIAKRVCYYPEDEEKMENMTRDEKWEYIEYLNKIGRFYYDDGSNDSLEELEKFLHKCGATLDDVIMKDTK